jgi:conjugal transfer pilus assembly protein TraK
MTQPHHRYLAGLLGVAMSCVAGAVLADAPATVGFTPPEATAPATSPAAPKARATRHGHARTRDPLAVDPTVAVKASTPKEIDVPGVLKVPGESLNFTDPSRVQKVSWANGGSKTVYMSVDEPNLVQLPFKNPYIVQTSDIKIERRPASNNIYVYWPSLPAQARQIFIEPPGGGPALGLQLVPKQIPAQSIIVTEETGSVSGRQKPKGASNDYVTRVQSVMEAIALNRTPDGYSQVDIDLPPIAMNGLAVTVNARYSDREGDLYVYTVRNPGQARALLREEEFDGPNVQAVSIFPSPLLQPGEATRVIVLARKREGQ